MSVTFQSDMSVLFVTPIPETSWIAPSTIKTGKLVF